MDFHKMIKSVLIIYVFTAMFLGGAISATELQYLTVEDETDWSNKTKGEYYIRFIARYAHIRKKEQDDGIWASLGDFFSGKENPQALVVASVGYKGNENNVEASSILLSLDPSGKEYDDSYISYNKPLLPPLRVSNFNQMNIALMIKESTVKDIAPFAKIVETANQIPMLNEATLGKIGIANDIINAISDVIPDQKGSKLRVSLDIDSRDKLFSIDTIIFYPSSERASIYKLKGNFPLNAEEKNESLPSMIVIDIEKRDRLIDDVTTLFKQTNPISSDLIKNANVLSNLDRDEKLAFCKKVLRPHIHNELGLNSIDSSLAIVMTMWKGGFDPDKTAAYLRKTGCFDFNELEMVRSLGGKVGSCTGNICRATTRFIQYWASSRELSELTQNSIKVRDNFTGVSSANLFTSQEFTNKYEATGTFRNIEPDFNVSNAEIDMYVNNIEKSVITKFYFNNIDQCRRSTEINNEYCKISRITFKNNNDMANRVTGGL